MLEGKKVTKTESLKEVLCVVFRSLKKTRKSVWTFGTTVCNSSLTYTTYKPSHRSHTIIPLSNHHTIIIPKSHNLRNICFITLFRSTTTSAIGTRPRWVRHLITIASSALQQRFGQNILARIPIMRRLLHVQRFARIGLHLRLQHLRNILKL